MDSEIPEAKGNSATHDQNSPGSVPENIEELRVLCQTESNAFENRHQKLYRLPSIYLTKLFLKIPWITPNHITGLTLLVQILAFLFMAYGTKEHLLVGLLLFETTFILDSIDGEIARARKMCSITGIFFDRVVHHFESIFFFTAIGHGLFKITGNIACFYIGFGAAAFQTMFILIIHLVDMAILRERAETMDKPSKVFNAENKLVKTDELQVLSPLESAKKQFRAYELLKPILYNPGPVSLLTVIAIVGMFYDVTMYMTGLIGIYGVTFFFFFFARLFLTVTSLRCEREYLGLFRDAKNIRNFK